MVRGVKDLVGRGRRRSTRRCDPRALLPSGRSAASAAFYAAAALIIGRTLQRRPQHVLIGLAVGIAVAVAASRVLLDLHWLSDVIGGLALGWGLFAFCAGMLGGRRRGRQQP